MTRASAPARLDFAGGWTDVAPFATERHGVVVNAAIELRAEAELALGGDRYILEAVDLGETADADWAGIQERDGRLELLKATIRIQGLPPCRLTTRAAAPPGSGLGSSGAMDVALVAASARAAGQAASPPELAERAWELETVEAALPGGKQDQYAAALGGFHRLDFSSSGVATRRLVILPAFADWLAEHVVVCYTGKSRVSAATISLGSVGDTSLYQNKPDFNLGGTTLVAGTNQQVSRSRGLFRFDLSSVPTDAVVTGVEVQLYCTRQPDPDQHGGPVSSDFSLHRLWVGWGEGAGTSR